MEFDNGFELYDVDISGLDHMLQLDQETADAYGDKAKPAGTPPVTEPPPEPEPTPEPEEPEPTPEPEPEPEPEEPPVDETPEQHKARKAPNKARTPDNK